MSKGQSGKYSVFRHNSDSNPIFSRTAIRCIVGRNVAGGVEPAQGAGSFGSDLPCGMREPETPFGMEKAFLPCLGRNQCKGLD